MSLRIFQMVDFIHNRLNNIEKNITRLDEKLANISSLHKNHLIRVKNKSMIDDQMILSESYYYDLTPHEAFQIYSNPDSDFILLDVSSSGTNKDGAKIEEALHIPLEDLNKKYHQIPSKSMTILVICENGVRSIRAAELLIQKGFYNVNNVSGGHEFWPSDCNKTVLFPTGS